MQANRRFRCALAVAELVVISVTAAVSVAMLMPALSHARQDSRAGRCAANLKTIGQGYPLWAADHGGFWPPRCRDATQPGCSLYDVTTHFVGSAPTGEELPYECQPDEGAPAIAMAGQPQPKEGAAPGSTDPADYCNPNLYPLNRYVIPNWSLGTDFGVSRCPSDRRTLIAPRRIWQTCNPAGAPGGAIVDCYVMWGTSYLTNVQDYLPWRGHGPWVGYIESPLKPHRKGGPNYSPEKIYKPARYMVMFDQGIVYDEWSYALDDFGLGKKNDSARWHEEAVGVPWQSGNALFGDLHVSFGQYDIPGDRLTLACIGKYVRAGWSLYPYKYTPISSCRNPEEEEEE